MVIKIDTIILAIETSCDETSVSIVKNGTLELATVVLSQMDTHQLYGGVVPEIASRAHVESITLVIEEALNQAGLTLKDITDIAVTYGPGLIGSLLIGLQAAKSLALALDKPLIPIHHIAGHIYANNLVRELEFPLLAMVVSGGHTELIIMNKHYDFKRIGSTLDDAVGEAYDKVARVMGLNYPGGPLVDKLAKDGEHNYRLPLPLDDDSYNFSFSGIKSAVINLVNTAKMKGEEINVANLAATFQNTVIEILVKKTNRAMQEHNIKNLLIAGGVAANQGLRNKLSELPLREGYNLMIPPFKYCTDNAAMIAAAAYYAKQKGITADYLLNSVSSEELR